jgi:hypothetical protein
LSSLWSYSISLCQKFQSMDLGAEVMIRDQINGDDETH